MPLLYVAIGVALLLLLMIRFKLNGFIALILVVYTSRQTLLPITC